MFSRADKIWKEKRRASSHAFYKDRLAAMLEIMKDKMEEDCEKWKKEIEESEKKETTVDFMYIFNRIFGRLIIHICFGEDISNIMLDIWAREPG